MKYLFIVQGEGRGHLTQAISLSQMIRRHGHEVVEVLVGKSSNREIPVFFLEKIGAKVKTFASPSFCYGKDHKKVKLTKSILLNITVKKLREYRKSVNLIHRHIQKTEPDVVINFYEILAGLMNLRFREHVPFVCIAHQFLMKHPDFQYGTGTGREEMLLRLNNTLCCIGATKTLALSFYPLKDFYRERMAVVPPLLREEVLQTTPEDKGYILGYMLNPGYADEVKEWHKSHPDQEAHFFWDKKTAPPVFRVNDRLTFHRINDVKFLEYMQGCSGYVTTAGFESVCEAMYLGKPVMMIPTHVEQEINAADAVGAGAGIESTTFDVSRLVEYIPTHNADSGAFRAWVQSAEELFIRHLTTLV